MPSNRRRNAKSAGKIISSTDRRLRFLQRRATPRRIGARAVTTANIAKRAVVTDSLSDDSVNNRTLASNAVKEDNIDDNAVTEDKIDDGAVTEDKLDPAIPGSIQTAQATANGKNKVYRQSSAPTGGTYATGDLWFDTDDDNKIYRWSGSAWTGFTLGDNALDSISANKITAGEIDASVITVSNIDAGNITVGTLNADLINVGTLNGDRVEEGSLGGTKITNNTISVNKLVAGFVSALQIDGGQISGGTIAASVSFVIGNNADIKSANNLFSVDAAGGVRLNSITSSSGNIAISGGGVGYPNVINTSNGINGQVATTTYTEGRYRRLGVGITAADITDGTITANDCSIGTGSGQIARGSHVHDIQGSSGSRSQTLTGNAQTISHDHTSGNYTAAISTRRLKKEISKYDFDTSKLLNTKLVKFKYKNQVKEYQNNKDWAYGYIAEDMIKIGLEELVGYAPDGRIASINYGVLSTLILELVKEHHVEIEKIKKTLDKIGTTK